VSKFASAERLAELLGEELEVYRQIRKLTEKQSKLLTRDEIEAFNGSLDKREELIEKIKGLHQETDPLMQSYISFSAGGENKIGKIDQLRQQIRDEIEFCAGLNDKNIAAMEEKTQDHIKKIDDKSSKRKSIGGYAQSVPNTPEVFDKKT